MTMPGVTNGWWRNTAPLVLAPELADAVRNLTIAGREIALGTLAGIHRSTRSGSSIEFSEHRRYSPGDDLRRIDWKALARTDRLHIKTFEDEVNLNLYLLCDHSGSMGYGYQGPTKLDKARVLAAALAHIALHQRDAVGLVGIRDGVTTWLPAASTPRHATRVASALLEMRPEGPSDLTRALSEVADRLPPRAVVIIVSDLIDPDCAFQPLLRALTARGLDCAVLHILDPAERSFPYQEPSLFEGMEDATTLFTHPAAIRRAYQDELGAFLAGVRRDAGAAGVGYYLLDDEQSPQMALTGFLRARQRA